MDAEALKIILELQKENTILHRAITDAICMLASRGKHRVLEYDDDDIQWLFAEIHNVLEDLQQKPTENNCRGLCAPSEETIEEFGRNISRMLDEYYGVLKRLRPVCEKARK